MNDSISRQSAIDAVSEGCQELRGIFSRCEANLLSLPSAQPERKRGEWKEITDRTMDCCYRCSECGFIRDAYFLEVTNFCPNCGADMRKVKEE